RPRSHRVYPKRRRQASTTSQHSNPAPHAIHMTAAVLITPARTDLIRRHLAAGFDDDLPNHVRVDRADIRVLAWRREGVGEGVVGVERRRCEGSVLVAYPVRAVVLILPSDGRAGSDGEGCRREG